jgi:hypothetical protein
MTGYLARRGLRLGITGHLLVGAAVGAGWALLACAVIQLIP